MGEVYRADDLKLEQPVAMKFLPESLEGDPARLVQLHNEVRLARQIAHKNVCRVYDVGEADGRPFLTMEYVDGEDLASLLRRIGRLPEDKGLELAR
jgi:serine/threonine protein kinase